MPAARTTAADARDGVRAYLAKLPAATRRALQPIRSAIRAALPDATEGISYSILGYRQEGRQIVWCAGWKAHVSLYPVSEAFARAHGIDIGDYETSKGTIKFPLTDLPAPVLVKRLAKARLAEVRRAAALRARS